MALKKTTIVNLVVLIGLFVGLSFLQHVVELRMSPKSMPLPEPVLSLPAEPSPEVKEIEEVPAIAEESTPPEAAVVDLPPAPPVQIPQVVRQKSVRKSKSPNAIEFDLDNEVARQEYLQQNKKGGVPSQPTTSGDYIPFERSQQTGIVMRQRR